MLHPADILYNLTLDALRAKARATFKHSDTKSITRITNLTDRESKCEEATFIMSVSTLFFLVHTQSFMAFYLQKTLI